MKTPLLTVFTALLSATSLADQPASANLEQSAAPTIVAARHLRAGDIIRSADLRIEGAQGGKTQSLESYAGLEVKRALYTGRAVGAGDLGPRTLVARNAIVAVEFARGPLLITIEARALDAGSAGDIIRVMNSESRRIFAAEIISDNRVRTQ